MHRDECFLSLALKYIPLDKQAHRALTGRNTHALLRSDILSGICAKFRTVAASNYRVHMP